jgi:hypothetical protein
MPQSVETLPFDLASVPWRSIVAAGDLVTFRQLRAKGALGTLGPGRSAGTPGVVLWPDDPALETRWVPWVRHLVDAGAVLEDPRLRRAAQALDNPARRLVGGRRALQQNNII